MGHGAGRIQGQREPPLNGASLGRRQITQLGLGFVPNQLIHTVANHALGHHGGAHIDGEQHHRANHQRASRSQGNPALHRLQTDLLHLFFYPTHRTS